MFYLILMDVICQLPLLRHVRCEEAKEYDEKWITHVHTVSCACVAVYVHVFMIYWGPFLALLGPVAPMGAKDQS